MILTEEEKREILSKYNDNTSNELLTHLKRTYTVTTQKLDWMKTPIKYIQIEDKTKILTGNKKNMVNKIFNLEDGKWNDIDEPTLRRTIKKYIDGNLIN
jgi:hypothetical protein